MENNKILLVVDMQHGLITKDNEYLINKINAIIKNYDKVYFTKFINKKGSLYDTELNWHSLQTEKEQKIAVGTPKGSIIFTKYGYGLNHNDLIFLKSQNLQSIDVCGLDTDACIYAISMQLFDNNIYPNILINYTFTKFPKNIITNILIRQFGKVDALE